MLPDSDNPDRGDARPLVQKIGWMAAIWLMSVGVIGVVAYAIRWWTTADSVSPLAAPAVGASLLAFVITYFIMFGAGTLYILKLMSKPATGHEEAAASGPLRTAGITPASADSTRRGQSGTMTEHGA